MNLRDPEPEEAPPEIKRNEYKKMGLYDFVRRDIERYMANPDLALQMSETVSSKQPKPPPDFVRNVWGSASGVGSGDFHIYRGIRRREYARLEAIEQEAEDVTANEEYRAKQQELIDLADAKTAKKRLKRQKKKLKRLNKKKVKSESNAVEDKSDSEEESD